MKKLLLVTATVVAKALHESNRVDRLLVTEVPHITGVSYRVIGVTANALATQFLARLREPERIPVGAQYRLATPRDSALRLLGLQEVSIPSIPAKGNNAYTFLRMIDVVLMGQNWHYWATKLSSIRCADDSGFLRPFSTKDEWLYAQNHHLVFDPLAGKFVDPT